MLLALNSLIQADCPSISVVEVVNSKAKDQPSKIFKDFNNSIQFIPHSNDEQLQEKNHLQVNCPQHEHSIEDINKVHLRSFNHSFNHSDLYMQSTIPSIKVGKKVKKKIENFVSDCSSIEPLPQSNYSFQFSET